MEFFGHDTKATTDEKITALRVEGGLEAVAIYWTILERIYLHEAPLDLSENQVETQSVSHWLGIGSETLQNAVSLMVEKGLLYREEDTGFIMSERAAEQIGKYQSKCETARQNGKKGGRKPKANRTLTKRKPKANRTLTETEPDGGNNKKIGLLYVNQSIDDASAAVETAAASTVPSCPECGAIASFNRGKWTCPEHGDIAPDFKAVG